MLLIVRACLDLRKHIFIVLSILYTDINDESLPFHDFGQSSSIHVHFDDEALVFTLLPLNLCWFPCRFDWPIRPRRRTGCTQMEFVRGSQMEELPPTGITSARVRGPLDQVRRSTARMCLFLSR